MTDASLARSSAVMALGTVASRLLGFVRTSTLTAVVGIGLAADTFDVANTLPNQFYLLLAGGVLNAVLVPQITKAATHDDGGHEFVNRLLTISFAIIAAATVVITMLAPFLVRLFSQGWDDEALGLATAFAVICLPQVLLYGLYTLLGQVLNARGHFAAYMWAPAAANLVAIAGLVVFRVAFGTEIPVGEWTGPMIWLLAGTATLGVAAQAVVLVVPLRRSGFRYRPVWGIRGSGLGSASRVALWTFAAIGVSQLGFIVTSKVMTRAGDLLHRDRPGRRRQGCVWRGLPPLHAPALAHHSLAGDRPVHPDVPGRPRGAHRRGRRRRRPRPEDARRSSCCPPLWPPSSSVPPRCGWPSPETRPSRPPPSPE